VDTDSLRAFLIERISVRSGVDSAVIDDDSPFAAYGLNSVDVAGLAGDVGRRLDRTVPVATLFEHPSIGALVEYLLTEPERREHPAPTPHPARHEPLAIVGIGCRLPGAGDPAAFWRLLHSGTDAVREVPASRWDTDTYWSAEQSEPGRTVSKWGGYLDDVDQFDPGAFGISATEADRMDPQQRLLLEVCWAAIEDAGWRLADLKGSATGVFVGISVNEYSRRLVDDQAGIDGTMSTGNALSVAANRLSYVFDLHGPSVAIDSACSSSLVAVHLAVRAVRNGDCDRAIVAGVNLLLDPELSIALSRAGMLSPDGRCKAFDAQADGYVRGEGCVAIVLAPASRAREDGDRSYALIHGSAVNSDGRTNGLTAPNPAAQQAVLRAAYTDAGIDPGRAGYVECHGTGTALGDPLEVNALGTVVGTDSAGPPCLIGSVKSNVGHLEAAAGLAGLLKATLAAHHGEIPPTLHVTEPNPALSLATTRLALADRLCDWPGDGPRYAGVSSFGFGGTNAHVVLEGVPVEPTAGTAERMLVLPLSARSPVALAALADAWADWLVSTPVDVDTAVHVAATRRDHHPYRLAVVGRSATTLAGELRRWLANHAGKPARWAIREPRVGFVFSGQGQQYSGMARAVTDDPLFASILRRCDEIGELDQPVTELLRDGDADRLTHTENAQPAVFALQAGLAAVLRAYGVEPGATVGHSIGEIAAAHVAGRLSLVDGMRIAVLRGKAMAGARGSGRMLATSLTEAEAETLCRSAGAVYIAAVNGPRHTVLSGDGNAVAGLHAELAEAGRPGTWLPGDYPFHSPLLTADVATAVKAADVDVRDGTVAWYSTVVGGAATDVAPDAAYWGRNASEQVRFADAVTAMAHDGIDAFVELGPHPTLLGAIRDLLRAAGRQDVPTFAVLDRDHSEGVLRALGALYVLGCDIRWHRLWPELPVVVSVPGYQWEHRRCWIDRPASRCPVPSGATLLGERIDIAAQALSTWECVLGVETAPFLADHRVAGEAVLPGSAYLELVVAAARARGVTGILSVTDVSFHRALNLDHGRRIVQVSLAGMGEDTWFTVHSRPVDRSGDWTEHATARIGGVVPEAVPVHSATGTEELESAAFYRAMSGNGLDYGPAFRRLRDIRRTEGTASAEIVGGRRGSALTTEVLDACFQLVAAAKPQQVEDSAAWLFTGVRSAHVAADVAATGSSWQARVHRLVERAGTVEADVQLLDAEGRTVLVDLRGVILREARTASEQPSDESVWLYEPVWRAVSGQESPTGKGPTGWLLLADDTGVAERIAGMVDPATVHCVVARPGADYGWRDAGEVTLDQTRPEHYRRLLAELPDGITYQAVELRAIVPDGDYAMRPEPTEVALCLMQALSDDIGAPVTELTVVTAGAYAVHEPREVRAPGSAALGGLAKALLFENPVLRWRCVDIDPDSAADLTALLTELRSPVGAEAEVALRGGQRYVRRLTRTSLPSAEPAVVSASGGYVITGGLGDLGLAVAGWLVQQGATAIALIGRSEPSPAAADQVTALRESADVRVLLADVADRAQLAAAVADARSALGGIRGVVHAAGVLRDGPILGMTAADVRLVFAPKVAGAAALFECCREDSIDWFVCFSSAAAVLGSPGQANYCAANTALDSFAQYCRGTGVRAITVDWGPWAEVGMAAWLNQDERTLRTAVGTIAPDLGVTMLGRLLAEDRPHTLVLGYDLRYLVQYHPGGPGLSLYDELVGGDDELLPGAGSGSRVARRPDLPHPYVAPRTELERRIAVLWQNALGVDVVGVDDTFFELGGDSVLGNQALVQINRMFDVTVGAEQAFRSFTVATLAELIEQEMIKHLNSLTEQEVSDAMRGM